MAPRPLGPRTGPIAPDAEALNPSTLQSLLEEMAQLRARLAAVEGVKRQARPYS